MQHFLISIMAIAIAAISLIDLNIDASRAGIKLTISNQHTNIKLALITFLTIFISLSELAAMRIDLYFLTL
jgi:hypothetical protein